MLNQFKLSFFWSIIPPVFLNIRGERNNIMATLISRFCLILVFVLLTGCSDGVPKEYIKGIQPQMVDCLTLGNQTFNTSNQGVSPATKKRMAAIAISAAKKRWSMSDVSSVKVVNLLFTTSGSTYSCDFSLTTDQTWSVISIEMDGNKVF